MTPAEFKSWFDGFTEALDGMPSKDQWKRIKERVGEIDGKQITQQVYVDRWGPYYHHYCYPYGVPSHWMHLRGAGNLSGVTGGGSGGVQSYNNMAISTPSFGGTQSHMATSTPSFGGAETMGFNSLQAMGDAGRAEAASMLLLEQS